MAMEAFMTMKASAITQSQTMEFLSGFPVASAVSLLRRIKHPPVRLVRCTQAAEATSLSLDDLKAQLDSLQAEAGRARARANTARARFMRLSETVENLRMRAASDLKAGREESARQLIAEKQKVMKALEKSKQRAELLEEYSIKLGEAISRKEVHLMASLSSSEIDTNDNYTLETNVRIISPREDFSLSEEALNSLGQSPEGNECENINLDVNDGGASSAGMDVSYSDEGDPRSECSAMLSARPDLFEKFLAKIDDELNHVDIQLYEFVNVASMILPEEAGSSENDKVTVVKQIWNDVKIARTRIQDFGQREG